MDERSAREGKRQESDMARLLDDLRIGSGEEPTSDEAGKSRA